jgi:hypothetical protein
VRILLEGNAFLALATIEIPKNFCYIRTLSEHLCTGISQSDSYSDRRRGGAHVARRWGLRQEVT